MKFLLPLLLIPLAACASNKSRPEPIVVPQKVTVPVAGDCVPASLGTAPDYVDSNDALRAAADAAERYQLLWAGRAQRTGRLNELEVVVAGCRK